MKNAAKVIISLVLVIIFLLACGVTVIAVSFGSWLHTYRTFTQKTLVAEVTVSGQKFDEEKELDYFDVRVKPVKTESALTRVFTTRNIDEEFVEEQEYKLYGDHLEIGGEMVKFRDFWNLFNLDNIYKLTRLEGDYTDVDKAREIGEDRSVYELNGGTDDYWKVLQENERNYSFLVDSVYGNFATRFVQSEEQVYKLYVTEDGFLLDEKE